MKVLVVAPSTDLLLVDDEVQQVVNALRAKVLQGSQANVHGLLAMLDESFDVVWFATHGDEFGVYLSDGILSPAEITAMVRSAGVSLVVLNTCSSRPVALTIHDELRISLVCTVRAVPDRTAFVTGTIFAKKLQQGFSYREAYEMAKPGQNSTYVFLPESETMERPQQKTDDSLESVVALVRRLEILVSGNSDYNVEGLVPTVRVLSRKIDSLIIEVSVMRANQALNRRLLMGVTFICIVLLVAMSILVLQRGIL